MGFDFGGLGPSEVFGSIGMTNSWIVVKEKPSGPVGALFFGARSKVKLISVKILGAVQGTITFYPFGSVSKPCTPGEHQNSW